MVEHQTNTEYGGIIIPASFGKNLASIATITLLILIAMYNYFGTYTRKTHFNGIVMPSTGLVKIIPQYTGYVTSLKVSEGQHATVGQPIYLISGERYNDKGNGTLAAMTLSVKTQYSLLSSQHLMEAHNNDQQQQALRQRIALLLQITSAQHRLWLAARQADLAASVMSRVKKLTVTHYVSDVEYQQKQIETTASQQNVEYQRHGLFQLNVAYEAATDDLVHLTAQGKNRNAELARQLQGLQQQLDDLAGQRHFTLTAPISGTVAAVLVKQGQSVLISDPMMTLVPDGASLQIELYATSQNAGFIQTGQSVSLRFSAFPY